MSSRLLGIKSVARRSEPFDTIKHIVSVGKKKLVEDSIDHFHRNIQPDDCMLREIVEGWLAEKVEIGDEPK